MFKSIRPVWAEISLDNLAHNMREIRRVAKSKDIMAIIKADAYGHGAMDVAPVLLENGATSLGVAVITEAIELRKAGIKAPLMILGYTPLTFSKEIIKYDIQQTVFTFEYAKALSNEAQKLGITAKIHIGLDTGMGRIGFLPNEESVNEVYAISKLPNIEIVGLFSHFSSADEEDKDYTYEQLDKFNNFYHELTKKGVKPKIRHIANSAAIIDLPETHFEAVRPGLILFGYYPSEEIHKEKIHLKPVLTLKTDVVHVKTMEKDMYISYGRKYKTEKESIIATLPIGYADGYTRLLFDKAKVIINGKLAPIVGRICMDQCMVDVTDIGEVKVGDEVILIGQQGNVKFDADDIAELLGTINYEIICMIGKRVPRVYIKDGKIIKVRNYM
ncbi:alanine racemase [Clostridium amylolyticum]|uniref:Alanine racemase n=1 Tax=Clostridium amylolyticum TaxID=1121298 RepID=A0A1M6H0F2_9CLOT|nr:alanine racemase [Clostridium amylolyticum]SHJ15612.1 alanine racemase [Clostridium amylolyticum]